MPRARDGEERKTVFIIVSLPSGETRLRPFYLFTCKKHSTIAPVLPFNLQKTQHDCAP